MKKTTIFLLTMALVLVAVAAFMLGRFMSHNGTHPAGVATSSSGESANKPNVRDLSAKNLEQREKNAKAICRHHESLIEELVKIAAEPDDPEFSYYDWHDSKHLAILLLGDLRAGQAVQTLLEDLEYYNPMIRGASYMDLGGRYPAAEASAKIGIPAVGPTIKKLRGYGEDELGRRLCCWILKEILGASLARLRVEMAIEEAQDPTLKQNLIAALPYFKTEQEKAAEERAQREKDAG